MSNYTLFQHKNQQCGKLLPSSVFKLTNFSAALSLAFLYWLDLTSLSYLNHSNLKLILLKQEICTMHFSVVWVLVFGDIEKDAFAVKRIMSIWPSGLHPSVKRDISLSLVINQNFCHTDLNLEQ